MTSRDALASHEAEVGNRCVGDGGYGEVKCGGCGRGKKMA